MSADPDSVGLGGESALSPLTFNLSTAIEKSLVQSGKAGPSSLSQQKQATANVLSWEGQWGLLDPRLPPMACVHHASLAPGG